jgi:cell division protein ZipA
MEADGLRWWLLIIGSLVIVGLAVHGIWLSRKNGENKEDPNKPNNEQEFQPSGWQSDTSSLDEVVNGEIDPTKDGLDIKFDIGMSDGGENEVFDLTNDMSATNDDLGLGQVRVVSGDPKVDAEPEQTLQPVINAEPDINPEPDINSEPDINPEPDMAPSKIYASVVTQPKPEYAAKYTSLAAEAAAIPPPQTITSKHRPESHKGGAQSLSASNQSHSSNESYQAPEPPPFLLKKKTPDSQNAENISVQTDVSSKVNPPNGQDENEVLVPPHKILDEKLSLSEQASNLVKRKKTEPVKKRLEPKIAQDQMRIDFDDQSIAKTEFKAAPKETLKAKPVVSEQPQEVLVLNVKCADENPIPGSALLPMLLTLGFKFGDQDIFHRHINSNGKGPVLFSLANMFKPGNFDIDNLENFTTQGISLFMILPIEGEPHQVFNMMHNAARKIADEFSAQIYDGKRTLLTKQSLQQYVEKIREFERQRLLGG